MSYDFEAELRVTEAYRASAPRPPLKFALAFRDYPEVETRAEVTPVGGGARGKVRVRILAQHFFAGRLSAEMVFDCRTGGDVVARGILTAVVNDSLRLPTGTHPDSVNLRRYPADVAAYIELHYSARAALARQRLQVLLGERPDCRLPRIVRAILYLGAGDTARLEAAIDLARTDYRDLLMSAEYERRDGGAATRVRDLSDGFPDAGQ